jgi:hypothetical protein
MPTLYRPLGDLEVDLEHVAHHHGRQDNLSDSGVKGDGKSLANVLPMGLARMIGHLHQYRNMDAQGAIT